MPAPTIIANSPAADEDGLLLGSVVSVTFSAEIDPGSIVDSGHFILTSSASDVVIAGPDSRDFTGDVLVNYLSQGTLPGIVTGKVSTTDNTTFKFTPDSPLDPNTTYKVVLSTSIVTKTLSAVTANAGNGGTGSLEVKGPYTGAAVANYTVTVIAAGVLGVATFRVSVGGVNGSTTVTDRLIDAGNGIDLVFKAGQYNVGDSFTFTGTPGEALAAINSFSFVTSDASYVDPSPVEAAVQIQEREVEGMRRIDGFPAQDLSPLALVEVTPVADTWNLPPGHRTFKLTFNKNIDAASLDTALIELVVENSPFDDEEQASVPLVVDSSVSGKVLTLTIR